MFHTGSCPGSVTKLSGFIVVSSGPRRDFGAGSHCLALQGFAWALSANFRFDASDSYSRSPLPCCSASKRAFSLVLSDVGPREPPVHYLLGRSQLAAQPGNCVFLPPIKTTPPAWAHARNPCRIIITRRHFAFRRFRPMAEPDRALASPE